MPEPQMNDLDGFQLFLHRCRLVIRSVQRRIAEGPNRHIIHETINILRAILANVNRIGQVPRYQDAMTRVSISLNLMIRQLANIIEEEHVARHDNHLCHRVTDGRLGASRYDISMQQLQLMVGARFTVRNMSQMLYPVSPRTISRRLQTANLHLREYSAITNNDLDGRVTGYHRRYPNAGYRTMLSMLRQDGVHVQRMRLRQSLQRVDPVGVAIRWSVTIQRRRYSVSGANALWHLDGNHALIRWGLVVSGCIDGYSRLITHLDVIDNNRASSTFASFLQGTLRFGLPMRLRCDHGGENRLVARYMIIRRGTGERSVLTGRSVHNQRIERLWVDVFARCLSAYYNLFHLMEAQNVLNLDNGLHLFALHYVYLPRIQRDLTTFANAWNHHSMDSQNGRTPLQTWTMNMARNRRYRAANHGHQDIQRMFNLQNIAQIQPHYTVPSRGNIHLDNATFNILRENIDPNRASNSRGVDVYRDVLHFISNHQMH
ncbi:uncharacterized protein LOC129284129 isoform X2 [Lytechinus pictus]|nr:uncharacterized protein LOC129284129 [Lytechinus pictus]